MGRKGERAMEKLQGFTDHVMLYVKTLVKWLLAAALIGTVGGAVGSLFHLGVEYATELRTEVPALLYALPLAGVLIVALYRFLRTQGVGTNAVLDAVHQGRELPILLIPAIFLATLLTHLAGGSAGREGAALQIGGDLGEHFGKMLRMDDKDCRLATLCGMSALFSALFSTPLAAVFFALEVVSIGVLYYSGLIPCITSSLVAYCLLDAAGTFADNRVIETLTAQAFDSGRVATLDECTKQVAASANCAYELTFLFAAVVCFVYVVLIRRDRLIPKREAPKYLGAVCETAGQFAYIYAIADTEHLAMSAPIISSYCAASVLWSRLFLKEKLSWKHYAMIALVIIGIAIMGVFDL